MTARVRRRAVLWAFVSAIALLLGACGPGPAETDSGPEIVVDDGIAPRLSPDVVAAIVLDRIRGDETLVGGALAPPRILRMTVTTSAKAGRVEPNAGGGLPERPGGGRSVVWVVRAVGTFATQRNLGPRPMSAASGFYVIADVDASIIGFGFP